MSIRDNQCLICMQAVFGNGRNNLARNCMQHLEQKHPKEYEEFKKLKREVDQEIDIARKKINFRAIAIFADPNYIV